MTPDHKLPLLAPSEDEPTTEAPDAGREVVCWANNIPAQMPLQKEEFLIRKAASTQQPPASPEEERLFSMAPFSAPHPERVGSIRESVHRALATDEPFTFFISNGEDHYVEMSLFDAIQTLKFTGELNEIEALELSHFCKEAMEKAAKINHRENPVDENLARKQHGLAKKRTLFLPGKITAFERLANKIFDRQNTVPLTEAIFWERHRGEITDRELMVLFKLCVWAMTKAGLEKNITELEKIKKAGLFHGQEEIAQFLELLGLNVFEKLEFKEEIEDLLGIKRIAPPSPSVKPADKEPLKNNEAVRIFQRFPKVHHVVIGVRALTTAIFTAGVMTAGWLTTSGDSSKSIAKPDTHKPSSPEVAPITTSKPPTPVASSKSSSLQASSEKSRPGSRTASHIELPSNTSTTPHATKNPAESQSISIPIATKPGPLGRPRLDEAASRKLWESAGFKISVIPGKSGGKAFKLSKNDQLFVVNPSEVTIGQSSMEIRQLPGK